MSKRYPGGVLSATPPTTSTSSATGIWTEQSVFQAVGAGTWPGVPGAPTIGTATGGNASASVTFTAPANNGGSAITSYTVTSSPGSLTGTGASSPITVSGLTNGTAYTFTVTATNATGTGPASAASNSVTPAAPNVIEDVFSTYLYPGTGVNQTITNGINLSGQGGLIWLKNRNNAAQDLNYYLMDTARGTNFNLSSNSVAPQAAYGIVPSVSSTGYVDAAGFPSSVNEVSWTFRKKSKFFDIVTYSGNGVSGREIPHNLGSAPGCVIIKCLNGETNWSTWHNGIAANQVLFLNTTDASSAEGDFNATAPTSTVFTVASFGRVNGSGFNYVAYLFADDAGGFGNSGNENVISCGAYTTNGSGVGSATLGYEPQWLLLKNASSAGGWQIIDNMRGFSAPGGGATRNLVANTADVEGTIGITVNATGFADPGVLVASGTVIYIAIRRGPMATPTVGTSVFNALSRTGTAATATVATTILPDLVMSQARGGTYNVFYDRLRGAQATLSPSLGTDAESFVSNGISAFNNTSYTVGSDASQNRINWNTYTYANWLFSRAPGFFDEVCYTGTGASSQTKTHNLGVTPELMIIKNRGPSGYTQNWTVYPGPLGTDQYMFLNTTAAAGTFGAYWGNTPPTSTGFTVGNYQDTNASTLTYVAYLFATCPGVSKVGSYTGTGATQTVNCGFSAGARWVLIKRTDSTGDWYVWDTVRGMVSGTDPSLLLNTTAAEVNANSVYTATTGFQIVSTAAGINASGGTYIFLAIA